MNAVPQSFLRQRRAGVLLHPTSLPGPAANGDFGADAYRFVDLLVATGQRIWQVLPLGPTHSDLSPYQSLSAFAGNRHLISLHRLVEWGWIDAEEVNIHDPLQLSRVMAHALAMFNKQAGEKERAEWHEFCAKARGWLDDYALFCVLRQEAGMRPWSEWPEPLRWREPAALQVARLRHAEEIEAIRFEQFLFYRQWQQLKRYANEHGVQMFGDMPIFVAHDSSDVWSQPEGFQLDTSGKPTVVAGVPPDYFSPTGQRWGNPHYDWAWMEQDDFHWWRRRIAWHLQMFDMVRVDHFRGFEASWEIPADEATAINGHWVKAPGAALFNALLTEFGALPIVAEDLGIITPEVEALRTQFGLPGMRILHFAFDGGATNPYLPHNHTHNSVVYSGTHDNDTTLGWYHGLSQDRQHHILHYLGDPHEEMPWPLLRAALASVACLAIIPMQDLLGLGTEHRMNTPGTTQGNWCWRFQWEWLTNEMASRLAEMTRLYGR
ncbi:MAG TPA: 4-alpha-glucanotransferase [Gammaproteobacteria bacterium]